MKSIKAFTLVELLIVVSLLAILTGVILNVLNPAGLRAKSRDSQRRADIEKLRSALELYYADNREYPTAANWTPLSSVSGLVPAYISTLPIDPSGAAGTVCSNSGWRDYAYYSDGSTYNLATSMEVADSGNTACLSYSVPCYVSGDSGPTPAYFLPSKLVYAAGVRSENFLSLAVVPAPSGEHHCYGVTSP